MIVAVMEVGIRIPWVRSLKEKRSHIKRLSSRVTSSFNVSIAEVAHHDVHGLIGLGVAVVTTDTRQADSVLDTLISFMQSNTEGELIVISRELL